MVISLLCRVGVSASGAAVCLDVARLEFGRGGSHRTAAAQGVDGTGCQSVILACRRRNSSSTATTSSKLSPPL
jgi:hypothetical protein